VCDQKLSTFPMVLARGLFFYLIFFFEYFLSSILFFFLNKNSMVGATAVPGFDLRSTVASHPGSNDQYSALFPPYSHHIDVLLDSSSVYKILQYGGYKKRRKKKSIVMRLGKHSNSISLERQRS
jgi:hypothetical protein